MSETTYYQRNRGMMLNTARRYYHDNIELLRKKAKNKCRQISDDKRNKKRKYGKNRYHDMPDDKKQKLKGYQKEYCVKRRHKLEKAKKSE